MKKVLALLLVAALMPLPALAQQAAGVVTTLDGTANVARATAPATATLRFKDNVFVRDRVTTGQESLVKMLMGGKALVTVRELSALTITEEAGKSAITLDNGKIAYSVPPNKMQPGEVHEIRTPNAIASVRGTVLVVEVERRSAQLGAAVPAITYIDCLTGVVFAAFIGGPFLQLAANQGVTITGNVLGPIRPARPNALAGLQARGKPGQGQKPKTASGTVASDLSSLGGGSGTSMPGASSSGGSESRVLPGNPKSGVYVP